MALSELPATPHSLMDYQTESGVSGGGLQFPHVTDGTLIQPLPSRGPASYSFHRPFPGSSLNIIFSPRALLVLGQEELGTALHAHLSRPHQSYPCCCPHTYGQGLPIIHSSAAGQDLRGSRCRREVRCPLRLLMRSEAVVLLALMSS